MVNKKNHAKDVFRKSPLYFGIGVCISLLLTITAFEWKFYNEGEIVDIGLSDQVFDELLDIPPTQQEPPPPPLKKAPPVVEEAPEEEILEEVEIDLDIEITETEVIEIFADTEPIEEEEVEQILTIVEEMPTPVGGYPAFYKFIAENIVYPPMARKAGIEGKVILQITVDKTGKLSDAVIAKGIGFGCDDEALRVINLWPKWNPGFQRGTPRTIRMFVPLAFKFSE
jgi:protein TonB